MADSDRLKWDSRYAGEATVRAAPTWIDALDLELPREGRALDVAAGSGRLALWAARRGLIVTAVDISRVGLDMARSSAERAGLALETHEMDLEQTELPPGPFALITCFHYRQPSLWPAMVARLAEGGVLVAEMLTVRNLERNAHPSRRWLAGTNELLRDANSLEVVFYREGWLDDRHVARVVARALAGEAAK